MKKGMMIIGNIVIFIAILAFVLLDVESERQRMLTSKTEAFENMTVAMESVTTNYLLGEQQVCNSWANYINANPMTEEEAIAYVRDSVSTSGVMAHVLFLENGEFSGLSTMASAVTPDNYAVSYKNVAIFNNGFDDLFSENGTVNVTRAYTNPINAIQSIAFCCLIHVRDSQSGQMREAALLRIIPVSAFEKRWAFPTKDYQNAEISLIDVSGDYVIKGHSFKNSNFYEFYQSYNDYNQAVRDELESQILGAPGSFEIRNSSAERCLIGHTRVNSTDDWIIVTMIPMKELKQSATNWTLVGIISAGLLLLLLFNLANLVYLNRQLKATAKEADRANQAKTDFLSTMSHDIRTPMNAIVGLTTIASKSMDDKTVVRDSLHKILLP